LFASPTGTATTYVDSAAANGTTYYYEVTAVNSGGESPRSAEVSATPQAPVVPALVASYSFDEGTGTTANDSSGSGNTGTVTNATWVAGKSGDALSFTGVSGSWVTVPNSASLQLAKGMTLEAWVNPSNLGSGVQGWDAVLAKEHRNSNNDVSYALYAANGTGTPPAVHVLIGSTDRGVQGAGVLALNTWTFLAATYDGSTLKLYVNGTLVPVRA
jgi:fibronectin type 3 domain-containing protein